MKSRTFENLDDGITTRFHNGISKWIEEEVENNNSIYVKATEEEMNSLAHTIINNPPTQVTIASLFNEAIINLKKGGQRVGL